MGSYWFYMYTTFFAIIALLFYVLENPHSPSVEDLLRDAYEGKDTLASLAARSLAADRCSRTLDVSKAVLLGTILLLANILLGSLRAST